MAVIQHSGNPFGWYVFCEHIRGTANKNRPATAKVCIKFIFCQSWRIGIWIYLLHIAIAAIVQAFAFDGIPSVTNELVHIPFSWI